MKENNIIFQCYNRMSSYKKLVNKGYGEFGKHKLSTKTIITLLFSTLHKLLLSPGLSSRIPDFPEKKATPELWGGAGLPLKLDHQNSGLSPDDFLHQCPISGPAQRKLKTWDISGPAEPRPQKQSKLLAGRPNLLLGVKVLRFVEVLAAVGGRGNQSVFLDPLFLTVGVKVELMPAQRVFKLLATALHRLLQRIESIATAIQNGQ